MAWPVTESTTPVLMIATVTTVPATTETPSITLPDTSRLTRAPSETRSRT